MSISRSIYQESSYAHRKFSFSSYLSFLHLFPLIFPLSHTHSSRALVVYITSSHHSFLPPSSALSLPLTLSLPLSSLQLNLFFFHPSSASTVQWETNWGRDTLGRLSLSLSLELIAVLQSVWFDFIGAIWFSNATFGVWLELRHEPNWEILLSSCCCHSHRAGNKGLAGFDFSVFLPLINAFTSLHTKSFFHSLLFSITTLQCSLFSPYAPLKFPAAYLPRWDYPKVLACREWRNWIGFRYDNHHCRLAPGGTRHSSNVFPAISRKHSFKTSLFL